MNVRLLQLIWSIPTFFRIGFVLAVLLQSSLLMMPLFIAAGSSPSTSKIHGSAFGNINIMALLRIDLNWSNAWIIEWLTGSLFLPLPGYFAWVMSVPPWIQIYLSFASHFLIPVISTLTFKLTFCGMLKRNNPLEFTSSSISELMENLTLPFTWKSSLKYHYGRSLMSLCFTKMKTNNCITTANQSPSLQEIQNYYILVYSQPIVMTMGNNARLMLLKLLVTIHVNVLMRCGMSGEWMKIKWYFWLQQSMFQFDESCF